VPPTIVAVVVVMVLQQIELDSTPPYDRVAHGYRHRDPHGIDDQAQGVRLDLQADLRGPLDRQDQYVSAGRP
jgi:hypothetical protein